MKRIDDWVAMVAMLRAPRPRESNNKPTQPQRKAKKDRSKVKAARKQRSRQ